jgi:hypothetical protein
MLKAITRNLLAFKTIFCPIVYVKFATFNFTFDSCDRFFGIIASATRTFILLSQICKANSTVHSAGGN